MTQHQPLRCLPTMEMAADALLQAGIACRGFVRGKKRTYRGVRLYSGQKELRQDLMYLLVRPETDFPVDASA